MEWESNATLEREPHVGDSVLLDRLAEAAADQPRMLAPAFGVNGEGAVSFIFNLLATNATSARWEA